MTGWIVAGLVLALGYLAVSWRAAVLVGRVVDARDRQVPTPDALNGADRAR